MKTKSFLVIGGGIIGSAIAREILLRRLGAVTLLEKEKSFGQHASGRNSGVIHSGINQRPGTLKARLCLEGSRQLRQYCREKGVVFKECGTLVVAQNEAEKSVLQALLQMGTEAGVSGLRLIDQTELKEREPSALGIQALLSPTGAVVDSLGLLHAVAREVEQLGGHYVFSEKVIDIRGQEAATENKTYAFDHLINAAGLYSDKVAHMMGAGLGYRIIPFRGEYMAVKDLPIQSMVYQAPDLRYPFLSVHLTREVDGRVLAGPTAALALGRESYQKEIHWQETWEMCRSKQLRKLIGSREFMKLAMHNASLSLWKSSFVREIQKICPSVTANQVSAAQAGIRAQMVDENGRMVNDMMVESAGNATHILNAVSPGMTAGLAFAVHVVDHMQTHGSF